jgi:hypothetical protein
MVNGRETQPDGARVGVERDDVVAPRVQCTDDSYSGRTAGPGDQDAHRAHPVEVLRREMPGQVLSGQVGHLVLAGPELVGTGRVERRRRHGAGDAR